MFNEQGGLSQTHSKIGAKKEDHRHTCIAEGTEKTSVGPFALVSGPMRGSEKEKLEPRGDFCPLSLVARQSGKRTIMLLLALAFARRVTLAVSVAITLANAQ